ncbi:MAG: outer membrane beta-barrel protein [Legionella sp.]|uniref:outer membrane protein n=1 Tax=Legionella sp. TaxID=459 RepID=UPI0039E21415
MRPLIKLSFTFGLIMNSSVFAADPVTGFYLGVLGDLSYATTSDSQFTFNPGSGPITANTELQPIGGGGGLSIGYRVNSAFRLEGELFFNANNYKDATIGTCTLVSSNLVSPQGSNCPAVVVNNGLGFNANIFGAYALLNAYYDILSSDPNASLFPYIGAGAGGAYVRNTAAVQTDKYPPAGATLIDVSANSSNTGFAVQGIVGVGYYLDDFATLGLDFRYITTLRSTNNNNSNNLSTSTILGSGSFGVATINLTATFALEKAVKDD